MKDLQGELEKINNEWLVLRSSWVEVSEYWRDTQREKFEHDFWDKFEEAIPEYIDQARQIAVTLDRVSQLLTSEIR